MFNLRKKAKITIKGPVSGIRLVVGYLGVTVLIIGLYCLIPLLVLPFYPEEVTYAKYFIVPGVFSIVVGYLLSFLIKNNPLYHLEKHQDTVLVVLVWAVSILICSMPFLLSGEYSFVQSLFEATSGFSTTGLSVVDVSTAPHIFLLHRSLMLFLGGVGLILVFTSILSDRYGMRLYNSEGHSDKLVPNLVRSARLILSIYIGYIILGTIMYCVFGMDFFDAINHSIAAVSTGGFSTQAESIGFYQSVGIEIITIVLMLLGNTNFFVHLYLVKGKFKNVLQNNETKFLIILFALIIPVLVWTLMKTGDYSLDSALRISLFQFVSSITTTGFQTVATFTPLPTIFNLIMILLMLIGAGIGSTGGGMKQQRVVIALKSIGWNIRDHLQNKRVLTTHYINKVGTKTVVDVKEQLDTFSFLALYLLLFLGGTLVFMSYGYSLMDSMFEFSSSLGTVGLSVGITAFSAPPLIHITSIIGMFFGRLEIYVILYAILKGPSSFRNRDEIR